MLTGAIPYGVLFFLLFSPPTGQELGLEDYGQGEDAGCQETGSTIIAYWFGFFYTLFFLLYTYTPVPYEALGPELSESYDERNQVFFIKKILNCPPVVRRLCDLVAGGGAGTGLASG